MSDSLHVVCPHCDGINRAPAARMGQGAQCGKCHEPLFDGHPVALGEGSFQRHIERGDLPVVVDFWAPWCGPCRMMAPAFEQAAASLGPGVRLAKVNTEEARNLGMQYGIRSIPTMVIFHHGREVARTSGAMGAGDIVNWVRGQLT